MKPQLAAISLLTVLGCGSKTEAPATPAPSATPATASEAALTALAVERGHLARDPWRALTEASGVLWQHGELTVRPLTGQLAVASDDVRVPLERGELVLVRTWGAEGWDLFALGPRSPRCAAGASCDAEGRVTAWREAGVTLSVSRAPDRIAIAAGARPFIEVRLADGHPVEVRVARPGAAAPVEAWPVRVSYRFESAAEGAAQDTRLLEVVRDGVATRYGYDAAGRLASVARAGREARISWDAAGRVSAIDGPGALATRLSYNITAGLRADVSASLVASGPVPAARTVRFTWAADGTVEALSAELGARRWSFDGAMRVTRFERDGAATTFGYDAAGRLETVRWPDGLAQRLARDAAGALTSVGEGTRVVPFEVGADGEPRAIGQGAGRETFSYGPDGALAAIERGATFERFTRDADGRVVRIDNSAGAKDELAWDAQSGLLASAKDERGAVDTFGYDERGRLATRRRADGTLERWQWDDEGRLLAQVGGDGRATRYGYDADGRLATVERPDGALTWRYDAFGRVIETTAPDGATTFQWRGDDLVASDGPTDRVRYTYDEHHRLIAEAHADGRRRELVWQPAADGGRLLSERTVGVGERRYTWDELGRLARLVVDSDVPGLAQDLRWSWGEDGGFTVEDALAHLTWSHHRLPARAGAPASWVRDGARALSGAVVAYTYDAHGALVATAASDRADTTVAYDALGRPTVLKDLARGERRFGWTQDGRLRAIDGDGLARRFDYDASGRMVAVDDGGARWTLAYDGPDVAALTDPLGRATRFTYDAHHRLVARTSPAAGEERFGWDEAGRAASHARADGSSVAWRYDELGRAIAVDVDGQPWRTLAWDGRGRLLADRTPTVARRYAYEGDRRTTVVEPATTSTRTRDAAGRTTELTLDGQLVARNTFGGDGLLRRVEGPAGFSFTPTRDAFGRRTGAELGGPSGGPRARLVERYDRARRLTGLDVVAASGAVWTAAFEYDARGRLSAITAADRRVAHTYEGGRLASATVSDGPGGASRARRWTFDAAGARTRVDDAAVTLDGAGRPVAGPFGARAWDAVGRMVGRGGDTLVYDRAGRLARVDRPGRDPIVYDYDGDGRLVSRREGAHAIAFAWDGDDLLALTDDGHTTLYVPDERAGQRLGLVVDGQPRYLVRGPDGRTLAVVAGDGTVVAAGLHDPWGPALDPALAAADRLHDRDRFVDPATGLVHFEMRWYDPAAGVFCAPDPDAGDFLSPETLDRYAYLGGDPVNRGDALGAQAHEWQTGQTCLEAVCGAFQKGAIQAGNAFGKALDGFSYAGAVERNGWNYDIWVKKIPGTDRVLTIFRDLNEKAEGYYGKANITGNIVLKDPPAITEPLGSAGSSTGSTSSFGAQIRNAADQVRIGAQLYGKEVTGTLGALGGLSGTLGTSVTTIASLPGGGLIIGAGVAIAGVAGYGVGTLINMIPGVSEGAQKILISVAGYETDQTLADLAAQQANQGDKAKEKAAKIIADNLAKDTLPPPPEPGVAGGSTHIGGPPEPSTRDRDRPPAPNAPDGDDEPDGDEPDGDDEPDTEPQDTAPQDADDDATPEILKRVAARKITVTFAIDLDASYGEFKNTVHCDETLTFWNVGALAPGYGTANFHGKCTASLNGTTTESSGSGTFSGGPNGSISVSGDAGAAVLQLHGGQTIDIPEVGSRALPAGSFSDWPPDLP